MHMFVCACMQYFRMELLNAELVSFHSLTCRHHEIMQKIEIIY